MRRGSVDQRGVDVPHRCQEPECDVLFTGRHGKFGYTHDARTGDIGLHSRFYNPVAMSMFYAAGRMDC